MYSLTIRTKSRGNSVQLDYYGVTLYYISVASATSFEWTLQPLLWFPMSAQLSRIVGVHCRQLKHYRV